MKKALIVAACLLTCAAAFPQNGKDRDWADFARYEEANKTAPRGAKAVFMGNSITQGWVDASPGFFKDNNYIGRGISGQVTSQMLVRFRADVIELQPKSVVILAGTNDIACNNGFITIDNIFGNIVSMAELAKAHGIKVIICSVLPVYDYKWAPGLEPAGKIIKLNGMLRQYADRNKIAYADLHSAMKDGRDGLPEEYAYDGVHPTAEGYRVMESILKPVIDKVAGR